MVTKIATCVLTFKKKLEFWMGKHCWVVTCLHFIYLLPPSHIALPNTRNIAEALISKGYGYCLRHRQDDDLRSSCYDDLLAAEARAIKNVKGVQSKRDMPAHRVSDISQVQSGGREGRGGEEEGGGRRRW